MQPAARCQLLQNHLQCSLSPDLLCCLAQVTSGEQPRYLTSLNARFAKLQTMLAGDESSPEHDTSLNDRHKGSATDIMDRVARGQEAGDPAALPPFDEPTELPDPACDIQELRDCLGSLMATEKKELSVQELHDLLAGDDKEAAHFFCEEMKTPFQCACKACDPEKLKTWNNEYWTQDEPAKEVITEMRAQARCRELKQVGPHNFPPGHGCNNIYMVLCEHELNSAFCPAVLSPKLQTNRFGIAQTLLNDRAQYIASKHTCTAGDEIGYDSEKHCRKVFEREFDAGSNYCAPLHGFIQCMCDACEDDVERETKSFARYQKCPVLKRALSEGSEECQNWYADECVTEGGAHYCENVVGSKAWQRVQEKPPPAEEPGWEQDGMSWLKYCQDVVGPMANNEEDLDANLGAGWGAWCREYLAKNGGAQADEEEEDYPNGSGFNGHARLPISGMPAPREADHDDVDNLVYDQTTSHVIEQ
jgi:hypothetical protein